MNHKTTRGVMACGLFLAAANASAVTITFDELASGVTLSNQYAALGAVFSPNGFSGANPNPPAGRTWATNTDMTVVNLDSNGSATYGTPLLVKGNVFHAFGSSNSPTGWLNENGDPSFKVSFSTPVNTFSADFAGVAGFVGTGSDVSIYAFNGATLLGRVNGQEGRAGQFTLSFSAASITSVVLTPGSAGDYVAVDNINFTPVTTVPEASTYAMMALGLGLLAWRRRRA
jgi:PEP-CTERM motif